MKFEVECKEDDTRMEIYRAAKPGLLLSMVSTLDTLSLDIQQCIIDCFNDFAMHASCSEVPMIPSMDSLHRQTWMNSSSSSARSSVKSPIPAD